MKTAVDETPPRDYFNHGWLETHYVFNFANYYNPLRVYSGALRVLNDDSATPSMGFDVHPHQDTEVISTSLKGHLRHSGSIRNTQAITLGDIQAMSAGKGIFHSEYNGNDKGQLEFLQVWIFLRIGDTEPKYNSYDIHPLLKRNEPVLITSSDDKMPTPIKRDAWFPMRTFGAGKNFEYKLHQEGNGIYIFITEGDVKVADNPLSKCDGIRPWDTKNFKMEVIQETTLLLVEVPMR